MSMTREDRGRLIAWYRALLEERRTAAQRAWDNGAGYVVSNPEGEDHFAYWRPGDVLPDLEARLTILRLWDQTADTMVYDMVGLETAVRWLAAAHSSAPGYDPTWLPA